ncbi:MAG TPA: nicotinate-nucleotide adenylyltransferase [Terriglobales bacterium]|nr:nicotinate-nucleotide adenylyltransferase [Terriglobales bacterium]
MKLGLFGGTFDPIHRGHIALAQAAREKFGLNRVLFVPANVPPHKQTQPLSAFAHRYAMVALATAADKALIPSLLEAPAEESVDASLRPPGKSVAMKSVEEKNLSAKSAPAGKNAASPPAANYTIDTIRRLKSSLKKIDELFFLIGIDAFRDIAQWRDAEQLFSEVEFIVASRPGYSLADVANSLPEKLRPAAHITKPFEKQPARGDLVLNGATVHVLDGIHHAISATAIREAVAAGKPLGKFVDPAVADYIKKADLYKTSQK